LSELKIFELSIFNSLKMVEAAGVELPWTPIISNCAYFRSLNPIDPLKSPHPGT
jgi:hypothetical protein